MITVTNLNDDFKFDYSQDFVNFINALMYRNYHCFSHYTSVAIAIPHGYPKEFILCMVKYCRMENFSLFVMDRKKEPMSYKLSEEKQFENHVVASIDATTGIYFLTDCLTDFKPFINSFSNKEKKGLKKHFDYDMKRALNQHYDAFIMYPTYDYYANRIGELLLTRPFQSMKMLIVGKDDNDEEVRKKIEDEFGWSNSTMTLLNKQSKTYGIKKGV